MSIHANAIRGSSASRDGSRFSRMLAGAVLLTGSLVASAPASADFLRQTAFANGSEDVTVVTPTNVSVNVSAGGFAGFYSTVQANLNSSPLLSYCIELTQTFGFGTLYDNYSMVPVATAPNSIVGGMGVAKATALARMLGDGRFADSFTSRVKSVAMQFAIWEVVYETAGNAYNLVADGFRVTSSESQGILDQAATYLSFTGTGTMAQIAALTSVAGSPTAGSQDFITVVPVPPSAALLGTGLLFGLWTMRRRRNNA
jgi:hypothetical protein